MREEQREEESISSYVASIEKSTTEDEIVETATKATSSSNIYSGFAELLSALEKKNSSKNEKSTRLLELFSFGTFEEYREKDTSLPKELNAKQIQKLKQLSVVSLSMETKVLSYEILMKKLALNSVRELEDFLIEKVIWPGIVKGQMNQKLSVFEVHSAIGRDPNRRENRVEEMLATMREWKQTCDDALRDIENQIVETKTEMEMEKLRKMELTRKQEEAEKRASAYASGGGGGAGHGNGGSEEMDVAMKEESGSAGGTKRKK